MFTCLQLFLFLGAMFPWESAVSGYEVCPEEVYGKHEIHITGDIVMAIKQHFYSTKSLKFLKEIGFLIVYQSALFFESRVQFDKTKNAYVINDVMPPDEYQYPVNNSVYTNVIAKLSLEFAVYCGSVLNVFVPESWSEIARNMYIPFDNKLQYHPEFEGFDITNSSSFVKQADTILISFPLMFPMPNNVKRNDLLFYANCTDPDGPAMTHSMFTIGLLEVGEENLAFEAFQNNFGNIKEPFKVWSELRDETGATNFITGAGGYLQSLIFGYLGVRLKQDSLSFNMTRIQTSSLQVNGIKYFGASIRLFVSKKLCYVQLISGIERNLFLRLDGKHLSLDKYSQINTCYGEIYHPQGTL